MEEQIKMAKLNAEFSKRQNDLSARKQANELAKHTRINRVDELYHHKKRQYLDQIAATRMKKQGLALDDPKRADLSEAIRNIEDELNILKDWRDIEIMRIVGESFAERTKLEDEGRHLGEWLDEEKIKVMEEQHAAKLAKEAAEFLQSPHIEQEEEGGDQ